MRAFGTASSRACRGQCQIEAHIRFRVPCTATLAAPPGAPGWDSSSLVRACIAAEVTGFLHLAKGVQRAPSGPEDADHADHLNQLFEITFGTHR